MSNRGRCIGCGTHNKESVVHWIVYMHTRWRIEPIGEAPKAKVMQSSTIISCTSILCNHTDKKPWRSHLNWALVFHVPLCRNPVANFTINQSKTIIGVFSKSYVRNKGTVRLLFQLIEEGDLDTCEMIKIGALGDAKVVFGLMSIMKHPQVV